MSSLLTRLLPTSLYETVRRRVSRHLASTVARLDDEDLDAMPLEQMVQHYYRVSHVLIDKINQRIPHFKLRKNGTVSFYDFIRARLPHDRPLRILDLGAGDCYLTWQLSSELHPASSFQCVDVHRPRKLYQNEQIMFTEEDVLTFVRQRRSPGYDAAVTAGFLGLLTDDERSAVLSFLASIPNVFVREVPLLTNLVDAYAVNELHLHTPWHRDFTEAQLKALLARHQLEIVSFEHEYDMYVHARGRKD